MVTPGAFCRRIALTPLLILLSLLAGGQFRQAPGASQAVQGLVNIRFAVDVRVFVVMAAINAAGFDTDSLELEEGRPRRLVRDSLASVDPGLLGSLRRFYSSHADAANPVEDQSRYVSFALLLGGPPDFRLDLPAAVIPEDAAPLKGMEILLRELWVQASLERLWQQVRPMYVEEIESYRPLIRDMIVSTLGYLRTPARVSLDRRITFIPDLLNAFGVVNARNIDEDYFVIVGPSRRDAKLITSVRHEYLHFLLDPLVVKYRALLPDSKPFVEQLNGMSGALRSYRQNFLLMVQESLVRAVEGRLRNKTSADRTADLVLNYEQGLILIPYFDERFAGFEKDTETIIAAVPRYLEGIRWDSESGRLQTMAELKRTLPAGEVAEEPRRLMEGLPVSPVRELLRQANSLLLARRFDEAEPILREALELDEHNASAIFGLAQIAARREDLEQALEFYGKAAASAGDDTWIAGWSYVHRGNIFQYRGENGRAREEWSRVLKLSGDLRGAAEAAAEALETHKEDPPARSARTGGTRNPVSAGLCRARGLTTPFGIAGVLPECSIRSVRAT